MRNLLFVLSFLVVGCVTMFAQNKTITGTVMGDDGLPIPGAAVMVKGTTTGTVTDLDGNYSVNVPSDATVLLYRFVGMVDQEQALDGRTTINVTLVSDSKEIDEVVVTAYGTSTKGTFTGSASVVKAETLNKRQVSNITEALSGMVAGVQVLSNNGQPGVESKIRIRGVGSINAGTSPLYVVDGVPYDGDLSTINSSDIESTTTLKDAASTALYGARGANGIIMITTKKGAEGKAKVSFDAKWGVNSRALENYDVLTSPAEYLEREYRAIYNNAIYNLKYSENIAHQYALEVMPLNQAGGSGYQIYTLPEGEDLIGVDGKLNPKAKLGYCDEDGFYYTPDNWADEMFKKHSRQQYDLSISGATNGLNYYGSFGYLNNEGIIEGSGFKRYSVRLKADNQVYEWLKVGGNFSFSRVENRYPSEQDSGASTSSANAFYLANMIAPIYPLYVRGADGSILTNNGRKVYDYGTSDEYAPCDRSFMSISNPMGDLLYNKTEYKKDVLHLNWYGDITPLNGLTISAKYGLDSDNTHYGDLGNAYMGQSAAFGGSAVQEATRTYGFDQQYILTFNKLLADVHGFDLTVGYDGYKFAEENVYARGQNLYNPESYYVSNTIDQKTGGGAKTEYATEGYFGRLNYSYSGKYIGNVAYRRDGSSRFSKDNRWGDFWSASAAWLISEEEFLSVDAIDMLKLKASVGQQGNDDIGGERYQYYADQDIFVVSGASGKFSDGALKFKGNPDLTWETSTSFNIGAEFSLFKSKVDGSVEYFSRTSSDMLYYKPVTTTLGYTQLPMNIGSMTNSGVEIDLNFALVETKDIAWNLNVNATFVKNEIKSLHKDLDGKLIDGSRIYEVGESMYRLYLMDWAGVEETTGLPQWWAVDEHGQRYKTTSYAVAQENKIATDNLMPKVYGGFNTTVEAFGFDLSAQAAYQLGGHIFDSGYQDLMHSGHSSYAGQNWHTDIRNAWTPDNTKTDVPRLDAGQGGRYANASSTRFLMKSNYLALNNVTLGYTLPQSLTEKMYVKKLRVYFAADNVALLTARKGMDPRQSYTSTTTALYTPIRTVSGGVSLSF